jgi:serine/threonine-protein kinase
VIAPGDVLHNRYRIERSIGRGGMGEVFSAVVLIPDHAEEDDLDVTWARPSAESLRVAVKVVSRSFVTDGAMARLHREAEAAFRIKSPFVPELIDVGTTSEGEVFLAMEILYGETLAARLREQTVLPWEQVFLLGDDVLSGLIDAHHAGVVHRDLKPSNIFICERTPPDMLERARILDFGVCKLEAPEEPERLTNTGESVGTVAYMAPEQIRGASHVTERADLYSFATVVFEALSGQLPHTGASQMAMLASKLERNAIRLNDVAEVPVPLGLEALLARLLSRDAGARFASAREVRDAWRALGPAIVAPNPSAAALPEAEPLSPATETSLTTGTVEVDSSMSHQVGLALAAFAVFVSLVALVLLVATRSQPRRPPPVVTAAPDPVVSSSVVDRPPADPAVAAGGEADFWPDPDAGARGNFAGPRPAGRPQPSLPGRLLPTKPHITDKPRY